MENTWDTTLEIKDKKRCLYQIWTHLRAFRKKVSLTFPTISVIWNMQLVLCICWDPVVLSFLWRGASALSGEVKKVKGNVTMEKKSNNKEGGEDTETVEGKNRMEPPEHKAGKVLEISWVKGSGYWGKCERKDLHKQSLFISLIFRYFYLLEC